MATIASAQSNSRIENPWRAEESHVDIQGWPHLRPHLTYPIIPKLSHQDGLEGKRGNHSYAYQDPSYIRRSCEYTFRDSRSDRVCDTVDIVSPRTSFAVLAVASLAIFAVSVEIRCSCAPTTVLDSEDDHFPLPGDLVALVDSITSSHVVATDSGVGSFDLGDSTSGSIFPASKMGVS